MDLSISLGFIMTLNWVWLQKAFLTSRVSLTWIWFWCYVMVMKTSGLNHSLLMLNVAFLACHALIKHSNEDTVLGQRQNFEIVQGQVGFWQSFIFKFKTYSKAVLCTDTTLSILHRVNQHYQLWHCQKLVLLCKPGVCDQLLFCKLLLD